MDKNLITYSNRIRKYASQILQKTRILNILSDFGKVETGGSYDLDLMYDPDIDICVISKNPRLSSIKALSKLIGLRLFQKYEYGDFEKFERKNRPKSFIIVLIFEYEGLKWEIEIWFLKKLDEREVQFQNKLKKSLNPKMRMRILERKKARRTRGLTKHQLSSFDIYKSLLNTSNN